MAEKGSAREAQHAANENKRRRAGKADRQEGSGRTGYGERIREKKLSEGSKAKGCGTRLFMLVLPFMAVGAYLLFN